MIAYMVGNVYDEFKKGGAEGPMFEYLGDNMGLLMIYKRNPSASYIEQFSKLTQFEVGLLYYHKQILITFKSEATKCVDMTYAPQLSNVVSMKELKNLETPDSGMIINIMLINSVNGKLENVHSISSSTEFNKQFVKAVKDKLETPYSRENDIRELQNIYAMFPTSEKMAKSVDVSFKIRD